jgi:methyl-accepting chemotaxis protein
MAVDEPRRIELFERLSDLVGAEATQTLFELLPPPGRDVATHDDVVHAGRELRDEFGQLRADFGELRDELGQLRADFGQLRGELRGELGELRGELATLGARIDASRTEVIATMHQEIGRALIVQTRTTVFSMVAALTAIAALALGLG